MPAKPPDEHENESAAAAVDAPAIDIRGLSKRFGPVAAVDGLDLAVRPGELFFLLGPSGCGKTTLLRMLAGLETPDGGTIRFFGRDVASLPPHRRGAPMVFQNYALWPHLSIYDNVAFGLVERNVPKPEVARRTAAALVQVGLEGMDNRKPAQLSGGQQQRVALARALVLSPGILLLDEPLANLDAKLRHEMRDEIERLHAGTDIAFVYVTHDQSEALSLADRLAVMDRGRILAVGRPDELYHRPPNRFTATFLGDANLFPGTVREIHQAVAVVETVLGPWAATGELENLPWNSPVDCVVRPENIRPAPEHPEADAPGNRFAARVLKLRVGGATVSAWLEASTRGGGVLPLRALWLNHPPGPRAPHAGMREGEVRMFAVDGEAVTLLPGKARAANPDASA